MFVQQNKIYLFMIKQLKFIISPIIVFIPMKRFTRKNNQIKSQGQLSNRKIKTQMDDGSQSISSQSTSRNISFDEISFQKFQSHPKPNPFFLYKILSAKVCKTLRDSFDSLSHKLIQQKKKLQNVNKIASKANKILFKLKNQAFNKIKQQKYRQNLKKEGLWMLHNCSLGIIKKMKSQTLLKLIHLTGSGLLQQNVKLRMVQSKYKQNLISPEYYKVFQKFLKISPKNIKLFLKSSEQLISPQLLILSQSLESQRINKNNPSISQLLINTIKNYIISVQQLNNKLLITQNQIKQLNEQKDHVSSEIRLLNKANEIKDKQFNKFDQQLKQKGQSLLQSNYNIASLKGLQRVIQYQNKICQGKKQVYQYKSRNIILKLVLLILNKLFVNIEIPQKNITSSSISTSQNLPINRNQPKPLLTSNSSIIQEQGSLQQSDFIQQVKLIVDQIIQLMQAVQNLKNDEKKKSFMSKFKEKSGISKNKTMPQLAGIVQKFQQILQKYCQKLFKCWELQNQNTQISQNFTLKIQKLTKQIQNKNKELLTLSQKFSLTSQQLIQQKQNTNFLQQALQTIKLQYKQIQLKLEQKTTDIQKLSTKNKQKSTKIYKMSQQYRRFKNIMDMDIENSKHQRQRSIELIIQKSLSKSKQKIDKRVYEGLKNVKSSIAVKSKNVSQVLNQKPKIIKQMGTLQRTPKRQPKLQTKFNLLNKTAKITPNSQNI